MFCIPAPAFAPGNMKRNEKPDSYQEQRLPTYYVFIKSGNLVVFKNIIL